MRKLELTHERRLHKCLSFLKHLDFEIPNQFKESYHQILFDNRCIAI